MDEGYCNNHISAKVPGEEVNIDIDFNPINISSYDRKEGSGGRDDENNEESRYITIRVNKIVLFYG